MLDPGPRRAAPTPGRRNRGAPPSVVSEDAHFDLALTGPTMLKVTISRSSAFSLRRRCSSRTSSFSRSGSVRVKPRSARPIGGDQIGKSPSAPLDHRSDRSDRSVSSSRSTRSPSRWSGSRKASASSPDCCQRKQPRRRRNAQPSEWSRLTRTAARAPASELDRFLRRRSGSAEPPASASDSRERVFDAGRNPTVRSRFSRC